MGNNAILNYDVKKESAATMTGNAKFWLKVGPNQYDKKSFPEKSLSRYCQKLISDSNDNTSETDKEQERLTAILEIIKNPSDDKCWKFALDNPRLVLYALGHYGKRVRIEDEDFLNGLNGMFCGAKRLKQIKGWKTFLLMHICRKIYNGILLRNSQLSPIHNVRRETPTKSL